MCGRFTRTMSWREIYELYRLTVERETDFKRENFKPRYNVAPTQDIPILRQPDGEPEMAIARWGLVPPWADGRFIANGSLFFMDYKDKQFQTLIPDDTSPTGITGKTVNAANSEIKGFEVDLSAVPAEGLNLSFGYTYLDTKYKDFTLFTTSAVSTGFAKNCTPTEVNGVPGCNVSSKGNQIERQPNHALSASGTYSVPVTEAFNVFGTVDIQYQSKRFIGAAERFSFGSYWNVDARLGLESENWSLFAYGENIFEDDTIRGGTGMGDFAAFGNAAFALNAPPKDQYGVRISYSW